MFGRRGIRKADLIGAPPGYVGYEEGGVLTEAGFQRAGRYRRLFARRPPRIAVHMLLGTLPGCIGDAVPLRTSEALTAAAGKRAGFHFRAANAALLACRRRLLRRGSAGTWLRGLRRRGAGDEQSNKSSSDRYGDTGHWPALLEGLEIWSLASFSANLKPVNWSNDTVSAAARAIARRPRKGGGLNGDFTAIPRIGQQGEMVSPPPYEAKSPRAEW